MGNAPSVVTDDSSDYQSFCNSSDRLQAEDELSTSNSTASNAPLNSHARQELRAHLFKCSPGELQAPSTSRYSTPKLSKPIVMGQSDRIDISEAIAILHQVKQSASPDELFALQQALLPSGSRTAPTTPSVAQTEAKSPRPGHPDQLTRRKSYFTPGVATREKSNKLQKRPASTRQPSKEQQQPWSPEMFGQSPLSKLAGWESKNDGLSERAVTPDITQSYLGAHALGSLRVTNGLAASPAPSIYSKLIKRPSQSSLKRHEDLFIASDDSNTNTQDNLAFQSPDPISGTGLDSTITKKDLGNPEHWESVPEFQTNSYDVIPTSSSETLRQLYKPQSSHDSLLLGRSATVLKPYQHELDSNPFLDSTADEGPHKIVADFESPLPSPQQQNKSPVLLYQTEADSNPFLPLIEKMDPEAEVNSSAGFSSSSDSGPPLHGDEINEHSSNTPSHSDSKGHINSLAVDHQSWLRAEAFSQLNGSPIKPNGACSAASSIYTSGSRKQNHAPDFLPKKHDSGYGSEASRSTSKDTLVPSFPSAPNSSHATPVEEKTNPSDVQVHTTSRAVVMHSARVKPALVSRYKDQADVSKPLPHTPSPAILPTPTRTTCQPTRPKSTPNLLLLTSPSSESHTESHTESPKPNPGPKKLQKKRPHSRRMSSEPLVVQSHSNVEQKLNALPQIPANVSARHSERMNQHPKMDHLERTYKSVAHEKSRDSFHSIEPFNVKIRFPSPTRSPDDNDPKEKRRELRRSSFGAEQIQSFFRRGERSRSGNGPLHPPYAPVDITDFGSVAGALGSSPYDLAAPPRDNPRRGRIPAPRASRHPHQMGSSGPRAKSAIGMSDQMASQFALQKSRDHREHVDDISKIPHFQSPKGVSSRPDMQSDIGEPRSRSGRPVPMDRDQTQLRRPRSWYASEELAQFDITEKPNDTSNTEPRVLPDSDTDMPSSGPGTLAKPEPEGDWSVSAKAWRLRRKSVGENLRSRAMHDAGIFPSSGVDTPTPRRPQKPPIRSPPPSPPKSAPPMPSQSAPMEPQLADKTPVRKSEKILQQPKLESVDPVRASSPTPSVLERAAAYERGINSPSSPERQSPTRRPPSPLKQSSWDTAETKPSQLPKSKFSAEQTFAASPSGVASAYAVSDSSFGQPDKTCDVGQLLFQRPPDLSSPKRRATYVSRKPVGSTS